MEYFNETTKIDNKDGIVVTTEKKMLPDGSFQEVRTTRKEEDRDYEKKETLIDGVKRSESIRSIPKQNGERENVTKIEREFDDNGQLESETIEITTWEYDAEHDYTSTMREKTENSYQNGVLRNQVKTNYIFRDEISREEKTFDDEENVEHSNKSETKKEYSKNNNSTTTTTTNKEYLNNELILNQIRETTFNPDMGAKSEKNTKYLFDSFGNLNREVMEEIFSKATTEEKYETETIESKRYKDDEIETQQKITKKTQTDDDGNHVETVTTTTENPNQKVL